MSRAFSLAAHFFQGKKEVWLLLYNKVQDSITYLLVHKCNYCFSLQTNTWQFFLLSLIHSSCKYRFANISKNGFLRQKWPKDKVRLTNLSATLALQWWYNMKTFISFLLFFTHFVWDKTNRFQLKRQKIKIFSESKRWIGPQTLCYCQPKKKKKGNSWEHKQFPSQHMAAAQGQLLE